MWSWKTGHICRSYLMFELCADVPGSSELVLKMMSQIQWLIAILPQFPIEMATYWSSPMFRQFKNIWWRLHHPNCQCNHKKNWETIQKWCLGKLQRGAVWLQMNLHHQSSYHCLNGGFHRFPKSWGYPQIINFYRVLHYKNVPLGKSF